MEASGLPLPGKSVRSNPSEIKKKEPEPWPSQSRYNCVSEIHAKNCAPDCRAHHSNTQRPCSPLTKCCRDCTIAEFSNCCADCLHPVTKCWRPPSTRRARPNRCGRYAISSFCLRRLEKSILTCSTVLHSRSLKRCSKPRRKGKSLPAFLQFYISFGARICGAGLSR